MLGETVAAATAAFRDGLDETDQHTPELLRLAVAGVVIVFALWWLYFDRPAHRPSLLWGYGHYIVFASAAATGAGLAVAVDHVTGHAEVSATLAGYAVVVPVSIYLLALWLLHGSTARAVPVVAALALATPLLAAPAEVLAVLLVALVALVSVRQSGPARPASCGPGAVSG